MPALLHAIDRRLLWLLPVFAPLTVVTRGEIGVFVLLGFAGWAALSCLAAWPRLRRTPTLVVLCIPILPILVGLERAGITERAWLGDPQVGGGALQAFAILVIAAWVALRGGAERDRWPWWIAGTSVAIGLQLLAQRAGAFGMEDAPGAPTGVLAGCLAVMAPFMACAVMRGDRTRIEVRGMVMVLLFAMVVIGLSGDLGAAAAAFVGMALVVWHERRQRGAGLPRKWAIWGGLLVPVVLLSLATAAPELGAGDPWPEAGSVRERRALHDHAVTALSKSGARDLLLGRGYGEIPRALAEVADPAPAGGIRTTKSLVYDEILERGLLGIALVSLVFAILFLRGWVSREPGRSAFIGALVAFVLQRIVGEPHPALDGLFALSCGGLLGSGAPATKATNAERAPALALPILLWGVLFLLIPR